MSKEVAVSCLLVFTVGVLFILGCELLKPLLDVLPWCLEAKRVLNETEGIQTAGLICSLSGGKKVPQMARDGFPDKQGTIAVTWRS